MKLKYTIILLILLIGVIFIGGCISSKSVPTPTSTPQVVYVTVVMPTPTPQIVYVPVTPVPTPVLTPNNYQYCSNTYPGSTYNPSTNKCDSSAVISTVSVLATRAKAISTAIDYLNPIVKNFANSQVQKSSSGNYNLNQVIDIWQSIYNQWTYVSDPPNFDYWTSASDSITNGLKGNCADYAVLNAAVIESIGGTARVVTACAPGGSPCHAYAEVLIDPSGIQSDANYICSTNNCKTINYHISTTSSGVKQDWLNLDWSANYPGGPFFKDDGTLQIYYPNGAYQTSNG